LLAVSGAEHGLGKGCNGGDAEDAFEYMAQFGLPDATCEAWAAADGVCNATARCENCMPRAISGDFDVNDFVCFPVKDYTTYFIKEYGELWGEAAMMSEIMARGPIVCNGTLC